MSSLLTLDGYQTLATRTAVYPGQGSFLGLMYVTGKLNGEAGEAAEEVFKSLRDDGIVEEGPNVIEQNITFPQDAISVQLGWITHERRLKLIKEMGDVLWYVSQVATELGITLGEIGEQNIAKLAKRAATNALHGAGSER